MEYTSPDFITVINSMLLLSDYQVNMIGYVGSGDTEEIKNAVVASAKAASILRVPVVLTSINSKANGEFLPEITGMFPGKEVIDRKPGCIDALGDERVAASLRIKAREKLIIAGLWTSTNFIETAMHAVDLGYDVFGLIDACGDITPEEHNAGVRSMLKSKVTPITWMSLTSEWMNGWANHSANETPEETFGKYNVMLSYLARH